MDSEFINTKLAIRTFYSKVILQQHYLKKNTYIFTHDTIVLNTHFHCTPLYIFKTVCFVRSSNLSKRLRGTESVREDRGE